MITLYVNALLCTLQHIVIHAMHRSALKYKEIIFSTFSKQ